MNNWFLKLASAIKAYKNIDEPKGRFKAFFWWSVLIIILATILESISEGDNTAFVASLNIFSKIVIAVFTSVAAAALIEIFSGIQDVWIKEQTQKEFREFFGCELKDRSVAIIIPRFPMTELKNKVPDIFNIDLDKAGAIKRLSEVNDMVLAYADVKTASDILIAFSQVNLLHLAEMVWDDDILDKWNAGETTGINTFIIVGLYSNRFFGKIYDAPNIRKFFKFETPETGEGFQFRIAKRSGKVLDWHTPRKAENDKRDYVLLSKVNLGANQKALIVGGNTAKGTEHIGEYLRENWKAIYARPDPSSNYQINIKDNEFAISILVPLPDGLLTPEDLYVNDLEE